LSYIEVVPSAQTLARIADTAAEQWGILTRRQIEDSGVAAATLQRLTADGTLQRVAHGVYQLAGSPIPDHLALRAAWLQLAPDVPAWERTFEDGVVSHRSAAAMYSLSHLPADRHDFIVPERRQTRRRDVRLHVLHLDAGEWVDHGGLLVTRPSRIAADLLADHEDPEAVAQLIADALRAAYDYPGTFADRLGPHAARFGLRRGDGLELLRWFLGLVGDPESSRWIDEAEEHEVRKIPTADVDERTGQVAR
jgi:hypothetical protein